MGILNLPDDSLCDDESVCTGVEFCSGILGCQAGTPLDLDDGVTCTVDDCHPVLGLSHTPDDSRCDDLSVCTGVEVCHANLDCQAGTPLDVDDAIPCTADTCDPVLGVSNTPDDSLCSDADACNGSEICDLALLTCRAGTPPVVDDGIACTEDSCDPALGVSNTPDHSLCSDSDACNGIEVCDVALDCQPVTPPVVDDGIACTVDACDPAVGVSNTPDHTACDDADVCTGVELCDAALDCQPGTPLAVDDGIGCTDDSCDPLLGVSNAPDDSLCDDADVCNGIELCDAELDCQPDTPPAVDDGIDCTIDSCDPVLGVSNAPDDSVCDDGLYCDGAETCETVIGCVAGTPPDCSDGVGCTFDTCNEGTTSCDNTPSDILCGGGPFCAGDRTCDAALDCQDGPSPCSGVEWCDEAGNTCLADGDGDAVPDVDDNCTIVANSLQQDTNADGYGNVCDPDVNNDLGVGIPDFNSLRSVFGTVLGDPGYDPDADFNSDDAIGLPDLNIIRSFFGGPPGPSGLACAGTPGCEGPSRCAHDVCEEGGALDPSCDDPCVADLCDQNPSCCDDLGGSWNSVCVQDVATVCGRTCFDPVGGWDMFVDWDCNGLPDSSDLTINGNGTFSASSGFDGPWLLVGDQIMLDADPPSTTVFTGRIAQGSDYMSGTLFTETGSSGCWEASWVGAEAD
ncbi:MAG: hypothetical protein JRH19_21320 [Deltaproteobacteria bacterium]|nr:hypothetical protein [Deltaproteobacteria bacterium]